MWCRRVENDELRLLQVDQRHPSRDARRRWVQTKKRGSVETSLGDQMPSGSLNQDPACNHHRSATGRVRAGLTCKGQDSKQLVPARLNPRVSQPCLFYAPIKAQRQPDCVVCVQRRHAPQSCRDSTSHSPLTGVSGWRAHVQSCPCLAIRGPRAVSKLRLRFWRRHHLAPVTPRTVLQSVPQCLRTRHLGPVPSARSAPRPRKTNT